VTAPLGSPLIPSGLSRAGVADTRLRLSETDG
jgi:hypothetical protein